MDSENKYFFKDMSVMFGRSIRHILRSMDTIITVCITPIAMMLLFVYVFGGAIETGADNYINYILPGIMLMAIGSGIAYVAYRLFTDKQRGIFERFHSMPIARSTVLWGHVLTSIISNGISNYTSSIRYGLPLFSRNPGMADGIWNSWNIYPCLDLDCCNCRTRG